LTGPETAGLPEDLERLLEAEGARVTERREIEHGAQYRVSRGTEAANLNLYRTGKVLVQGRESKLKSALQGYGGGGSGAKATSTQRPSARRLILDPTPRTGTDEAGKGDYFGPLVVAGVRVLGEREARGLLELGVRDSKLLGAGALEGMAERIPGVVGEENVRVVVLDPPEYEERRRAAGDINRLLGEINVEILSDLADEVELFVVDEFARAARPYIEPHLAGGVRLEVRPRAEDDLAVAAASVLARARYLQGLDLLSEEVGVRLPKGATHVREAVRRVFRERGAEGLKRVAKVHFATTEKVLGKGWETRA
jgi:ribonuclease HIII